MVPSAPIEARWICSQPRRSIALPVMERLVRTAFPRCHVVQVQPFADGYRNANFKVRIDTQPEWTVVRIYEHDASLCQKEVDLIQLIRGSVPVPEIIHAEPDGLDDLPPFAVMGYIEGISFGELKRCGDREAIAQVAYSAGENACGDRLSHFCRRRMAIARASRDCAVVARSRSFAKIC